MGCLRVHALNKGSDKLPSTSCFERRKEWIWNGFPMISFQGCLDFLLLPAIYILLPATDSLSTIFGSILDTVKPRLI